MDGSTNELQQLQAKIAKLQSDLSDYQLQVSELEKAKLQLQQTLKLTEEKLHATLDGTGLCLWEQDIPSGILTMYNQEWGHY